jgi:hypothetical protein
MGAKKRKDATYEKTYLNHLHPERGMRLLDLCRLHDRARRRNGTAA